MEILFFKADYFFFQKKAIPILWERPFYEIEKKKDKKKMEMDSRSSFK
jgi:hypothetical protein